MPITRAGYSSKRAQRRARKQARFDAKKQLPAEPQLVVLRELSSKPVFDPNNPTHVRWQEERQEHPLVPQWTTELQAVKKEQTKHASKWTWRLTAVGLGLAEFMAVSQLLGSMGIENPHRFVIAAAGSCILFVFVSWAAKGVKS